MHRGRRRAALQSISQVARAILAEVSRERKHRTSVHRLCKWRLSEIRYRPRYLGNAQAITRENIAADNAAPIQLGTHFFGRGREGGGGRRNARCATSRNQERIAKRSDAGAIRAHPRTRTRRADSEI